MDPRKLFADERLTGFCVYCGGKVESRDHCPSKILLDEPYPTNLPVVDACSKCNSAFSSDEQYVACLIECAICGTASPDAVQRKKVKSTLREKPAIAARIEAGRIVRDDGSITWQPEIDRVVSVLLKLARGHIAYELSLPKLDAPAHLFHGPMCTMSQKDREEFEDAGVFGPELSVMAPSAEVGSRAFLRSFGELPSPSEDGWIVVQRGRYRYLVGQEQSDFVQLVLSEYLACRVEWE